jgi:hypothetical protein
MTLTPGRLFVALGIAFCLWPLPAYSRTWHVRNDGTGDAPTVQAAIDSAVAGDTITLAKGLFSADSMITCPTKNDLVINSEAGPDSTSLLFGGSSGFLKIVYCGGLSIEGILFRDAPGSALSVSMSSRIAVSNCRFFNNGHYYGKSALMFEWCDSIDVHDSVWGGNRGGVMFYEEDSNILIYNNTFLGDVSHEINLNGVINCSISNSIVSGSSYGIIGIASNLTMACNNVYNNTENYAITAFPDPTGQNGNISVDPQFCSIDPVAYNNYHLQSDSPCAPGNHPSGYACGLIGCESVGCATTGTEKTSWSKVKQLFK